MPRFWRARCDAVDAAVGSLHAAHTRLDPQDPRASVKLFLDLPLDWPVCPEQFGLTWEDIFNQELLLWQQRAAESAAFGGTIFDAWNANLDVVKLLPYFLAVAFSLRRLVRHGESPNMRGAGITGEGISKNSDVVRQSDTNFISVSHPPSMVGSGKRAKRPAAEGGAGRKGKAERAIAESDEPAKKRQRTDEEDDQAVSCPITARAAEIAVNKALEATGLQVHRKPFQIRTHAQKRKRKTFQLSCANSQHHACSWHGLATHHSKGRNEDFLDTWQMCHGQHGDQEALRKKRTEMQGRRARAQHQRANQVHWRFRQPKPYSSCSEAFRRPYPAAFWLIAGHASQTRKGPPVFSNATHTHFEAAFGLNANGPLQLP